MESSQTSFSRAQSIPVTRSEHASVPSHQEIHSSLRSILRPSRLVQKIDEEQSPASFDISNFSKVLETTSDSDESPPTTKIPSADFRQVDEKKEVSLHLRLLLREHGQHLEFCNQQEREPGPTCLSMKQSHHLGFLEI